MGQTGHRRADAASRRDSADRFHDLVATAKRLRAPGGCAWDRRQTIESLLPYLVEETWEAFEAVRSRRSRHLREELGDVLYTVLTMALIAEEDRRFTLASLLRATRRKMIRRHLHVFGAKKAATPEDAYRAWQASKRLEPPSGPSPSDAFRAMLVNWWDWLHQHPDAAQRRAAPWPRGRNANALSGSPRRPRARRATA